LLNSGFGLSTTVTKLFTVGKEGPKGITGFRYKGYLDIFEPLDIKLI
jgi:hypothetical protein